MKSKSWTNKYGTVENNVLKELIIYRDTWLRGDMGNSRLLRGGKRCCVGFMAAACGVPDKALIEKAYVRHLFWSYQHMVLEDSSDDHASFDLPSVMNRVYLLNDLGSITSIERERRITKFFKETYDVKVFFKDVEPKLGARL